MLKDDVYKYIRDNYNDRDVTIFRDYVRGYNPKEIARRRNLSISIKRVYHIIEEIHDEVVSFVYNNAPFSEH